jgi:hypothetical protein
VASQDRLADELEEHGMNWCQYLHKTVWRGRSNVNRWSEYDSLNEELFPVATATYSNK